MLTQGDKKNDELQWTLVKIDKAGLKILQKLVCFIQDQKLLSYNIYRQISGIAEEKI